jgi:hypothetical protein
LKKSRNESEIGRAVRGRSCRLAPEALSRFS